MTQEAIAQILDKSIPFNLTKEARDIAAKNIAVAIAAQFEQLVQERDAIAAARDLNYHRLEEQISRNNQLRARLQEVEETRGKLQDKLNAYAVAYKLTQPPTNDHPTSNNPA